MKTRELKFKRLKLTKASEKDLYNYHAGCGRCFLSEGTGMEIKNFPITFFHRNGRYVLRMGNMDAIELTKEQIREIGCFAVHDKEYET